MVYNSIHKHNLLKQKTESNYKFQYKNAYPNSRFS